MSGKSVGVFKMTRRLCRTREMKRLIECIGLKCESVIKQSCKTFVHHYKKELMG